MSSPVQEPWISKNPIQLLFPLCLAPWKRSGSGLFSHIGPARRRETETECRDKLRFMGTTRQWLTPTHTCWQCYTLRLLLKSNAASHTHSTEPQGEAPGNGTAWLRAAVPKLALKGNWPEQHWGSTYPKPGSRGFNWNCKSSLLHQAVYYMKHHRERIQSPSHPGRNDDWKNSLT